MWNKLSVSKKIMASLASMLVMTIIMFCVSQYALHESATVFKNLTTRDGPIIDECHEAKFLLLDTRRYEKDALYNDDQSLENHLVENAQKLKDSAQALSEKIARTDRTEMKDLSLKFQESATTYLETLKVVIATPVGQERMVAALPMRKALNLSEEKIQQLLELSLKHVRGMAVHTARTASITQILVLAIGILSICLSGAIVVILRLSIVNPLNRLHRRTEDLAKGELGAPIPFLTRDDEIGAMAKALCVFRDNRTEAENLRKDQEAQRLLAEQDKKNALNQLVERFESSVRGVATTVVGAANELQTTAQAMKETVNVTISAVSQMAQQVAESQQASHQATDNVRRSDAMVTSLNEAVARISDVSNLISKIAGQTNLLALNATIEAARAGEAGRGFSVVANEVKGLAAQTGKATNEISEQIASVQKAAEDTISSIRSIDGSIVNISNINTKLAFAVQQSASTEHTTDVINVTESVAATTRAADQVLQAADELSHQGATMLEEIERVKAYVIVLANK